MSLQRPLKIAPSLLAADFAHLADEIAGVEKAGCEMLHVDVMDGHFVPNLTVGPAVVRSIDRITTLPLDVHLMIENPEKYLKVFADAGADHLTVHAEACEGRLGRVIEAIRSCGTGCGVSLKPASPLRQLEGFLDRIDMVLLMTVNPGFGGQSFLREVLPKIGELRRVFSGDIQVDGGINRETAKEAVRAGANVLVAGTAIFGRPDVRQAIEDLRRG
ncbi:MAG: ribulose-phosphate 3-epimerase [Candidatus Omnitrophica bacterium]|nr:ribulose-phosphate 3-epimerase [Candidatus Omnitrophota bacterium]